jgi:hypothetical protein
MWKNFCLNYDFEQMPHPQPFSRGEGGWQHSFTCLNCDFE